MQLIRNGMRVFVTDPIAFWLRVQRGWCTSTHQILVSAHFGSLIKTHTCMPSTPPNNLKEPHTYVCVFEDMAVGQNPVPPVNIQNRWQMDVHPPQNGIVIGYAPWPYLLVSWRASHRVISTPLTPHLQSLVRGARLGGVIGRQV